VGLPLPVRRPRPIEGPDARIGRDVADRSIVRMIPDGVVVETVDAQRILRLYGRDEAAEWWETRAPGPGLVFRIDEGRLLPPSLAVRLFPEIDDYEPG